MSGRQNDRDRTTDRGQKGDRVGLHWKFAEMSHWVVSSPTVVDGTVFVGSHDNTLYAVDAATGKQEWAFEEPSNWVNSSPAVADGTVYVGSHDNTLYAVNTATGRREWAFEEPSRSVYSSPTVANGTVYAGSRDRRLYAVDTATGKQEWAFTEPSHYVDSSPTVVGGTVYISSKNETLYAVDAETGAQRWAFTEPSGVRAVRIGIELESSPTVVDDTVYVGSRDGTLYAVDRASGTVTWRFTEPSGWIESSPTVADGTVYVGSRDGSLYAVDTATGTLDWAFTEPSDRIFSSPTVADGTVYVGGQDGVVYAVSATTGTQQWAYTQPSGAVRSSPTVVDGIVYVGSNDGTLYAIDARIGGSSAGSRVLLGTLGHQDQKRLDTQLSTGETHLNGAKGVPENIRAEREAREQTTDALARPETALDDAGASDSDSSRNAPEQRPGRVQGQTEGVRTGAPATTPTMSGHSLSYDYIEMRDNIGGGGNADVYHATATANGETMELALKEPRMSGTLHTDVVERMLEEAETWQQLDDHDHIVSVVDYGSEPLPWIAMEYMDAGHLGERADEFDFEQALWTAIATTKGVRHAHRRGVAHLDLKPENILFRSAEGWDVPKVADWGLSKHLLKHSKSVEGLSPHYAAPEQFDDEYGSTDDVTDIYQLGAVFYELFTGRPPFEGPPARVMNRVLTEEPEPPSEVADAPRDLDDVLTTALAKEKADRYESVLYFRDNLQALFDDIA